MSESEELEHQEEACEEAESNDAQEENENSSPDKNLNESKTKRYKGTVKWFNIKKGFGFIDYGDSDIYVHHSAIRSEGFRTLNEGQEVEFIIVSGENGREKAESITGPNGENLLPEPKFQHYLSMKQKNHNEKQWENVQVPAGKVLGTVKWFNDQKGFGFISYENDKDIFVHQSEIQCKGFRSLEEGQRVSFEKIVDDGREKAANVTSPDGSILPSAQSEGEKIIKSSIQNNYREPLRDEFELPPHPMPRMPHYYSSNYSSFSRAQHEFNPPLPHYKEYGPPRSHPSEYGPPRSHPSEYGPHRSHTSEYGPPRLHHSEYCPPRSPTNGYTPARMPNSYGSQRLPYKPQRQCHFQRS